MKYDNIKWNCDDELKNDLSAFLGKLGEIDTLISCLWRMMNGRKVSASGVYSKAELDRQIYDKLINFANPKRASKTTLLKICIGLEASEEEAYHLLGTCGFTFDLTQSFDVAVLYCVQKGKYSMYDVYEIQDLLDSGLNNTNDNTATELPSRNSER